MNNNWIPDRWVKDYQRSYGVIGTNAVGEFYAELYHRDNLLTEKCGMATLEEAQQWLDAEVERGL